MGCGAFAYDCSGASTVRPCALPLDKISNGCSKSEAGEGTHSQSRPSLCLFLGVFACGVRPDARERVGTGVDGFNVLKTENPVYLSLQMSLPWTFSTGWILFETPHQWVPFQSGPMMRFWRAVSTTSFVTTWI